MSKKLKIYLDTSVIGGCFDEELSFWSEKIIEDFKKEQNKSLFINYYRSRNGRRP